MKRFKTFIISLLFFSNIFSFASIPNIHVNHLNTTDTLTYSSLSSTMFSNSKSESKGASYTFDKKTKEEKETELETGKLINKGLGWSNVKTALIDLDIIGEGDTSQYGPTVGITERLQDAMTPSSDYQSWSDLKEYKEKVEDAESKFKKDTGMDKDSDIWNYSMSMGYSSEKTQATLGQGNIVVKDKDNSDDINGLNRNVDNMNNLLYSGGIGLDVESTSMIGMPSTIKDAINGIGDIYLSTSNVDTMLDGVNFVRNGMTNTINIINYFGNLYNNAEQLKNVPTYILNGEKDSVINAFQINDKSQAIPFPSGLIFINSAWGTANNANSFIDNFWQCRQYV